MVEDVILCRSIDSSLSLTDLALARSRRMMYGLDWGLCIFSHKGFIWMLVIMQERRKTVIGNRDSI